MNKKNLQHSWNRINYSPFLHTCSCGVSREVMVHFKFEILPAREGARDGE